MPTIEEDREMSEKPTDVLVAEIIGLDVTPSGEMHRIDGYGFAPLPRFSLDVSAAMGALEAWRIIGVKAGFSMRAYQVDSPQGLVDDYFVRVWPEGTAQSLVGRRGETLPAAIVAALLATVEKP